MLLNLRDMQTRRSQRVSVKETIRKNPRPPTHQATALFQTCYRLEATVACTFWANAAQMDRAEEQAKKTLHHYLYADAIAVLFDMELAVEEMDQDQLRKACLDMRDIFAPTQEDTP